MLKTNLKLSKDIKTDDVKIFCKKIDKIIDLNGAAFALEHGIDAILLQSSNSEMWKAAIEITSKKESIISNTSTSIDMDTGKIFSIDSKKRKKDDLDQNTFDFMEAENQRGIFGDLPSRNLYAGEDLDVPAYLRRGVKIAI